MNKTLLRRNWLGLAWEKTFTTSLPNDKISENYVRQVKDACYSFVKPQFFPLPSICIISLSVCQLLGISPEKAASKDFLSIFSGQQSLEDIEPWACYYAGHQFGFWAGQLGDGRAITIGELRSPQNKLFDIQLKGSGKTPYSRQGDGKAVLRSCIREYLASEAMFYLGVPTTRALAVLRTGEKVIRDILYDGNPNPEPGALLCRVSESLIRFGSFEAFSFLQKDPALLKQLLDYSIGRNFSDLEAEAAPGRYFSWLERVVRSTAKLAAKWQSVGFVHGVLNTDNMSILGETLDYGPFGFMEEFEPGWTPNTTDGDSHRYTYEQQPGICLWNLSKLSAALMPLLEDEGRVRAILEKFKGFYSDFYVNEFGKKLGFEKCENRKAVENLAKEITELLSLCKFDLTIFFRKFAEFDPFDASDSSLDNFLEIISEAMYDFSKFKIYLPRWQNFLEKYKEELVKNEIDITTRKKIMNSANPKYILRNWQLQECILKAEEGNFEMLRELDEMIQNPFDEQPKFEKYFKKRPDWAKKLPGYSMLSCSS